MSNHNEQGKTYCKRVQSRRRNRLWRNFHTSDKIRDYEMIASLCLHEWFQAVPNGREECLPKWDCKWRNLCITDHLYPNHVYKLKKTLYGLKQTPRQWYERLNNFFLSHNCERGKIHKTLFIIKSNSVVILVQIYVNNIIFR